MSGLGAHHEVGEQKMRCMNSSVVVAGTGKPLHALHLALGDGKRLF